MRSASVDPWSVATAAASGAVLGILAATAYHVLHDHSHLSFADVLRKHPRSHADFERRA